MVFRPIALVVVVLGCGAACNGGEDFEACHLDALSGAWRVSYIETDGNCGPISDETTVIGGDPPAGCTVRVNDISADRCEQTQDFTCPTTDDAGTQSWVVVWEHIAEEHVIGTGTVEINHPQGTCRSTYSLDARKL